MDAAIRFEHWFTGKLAALRGVKSVSMATSLPASGGNSTIRFLEKGRLESAIEDECDVLTVNACNHLSASRTKLFDGSELLGLNRGRTGCVREYRARPTGVGTQLSAVAA
jgi:hypothetical protein